MQIKQDFSKDTIKTSRDSGIVAFTISLVSETIVVTPTSTVSQQRGDSQYDVVTASTVYDGGRLTASNTVGNFNSWQSLDTSVATIDEYGQITRISEGTGVFSFTDKGVTKVFYVNLNNRVGSESVYTFQNVLAGSLAEHLSAQVDDRINSGMSLATNAPLYTTQDHSTPSYVRNTNFWANDVDLTCISPWNSNSANRKAGTLITPRHILNSAHYEFPVGTSVRFITSDNQVITRTVVGRKRHPDYSLSGYQPDLTIYTLDSDLPASISFCKLMPSDYTDYITRENLVDTRIAAFGLDQEEKGLVRDISNNTQIEFQEPTDADRLLLYERIISGDSGNPVFVIFNGELVLLTVWTFGGAGKGSLVANYISDLNQMIVDSDSNAGVSTGYTVTEADFSSFPTYS